MGDERSDANTDTVNFDDDAPTERIPIEDVKRTDPAHAGVLDSKIAASIRMDFGETVADEDRMTFIGIVDSEGRILVPENVRGARGIQPGDELLIQAQKIS